MAELPGRPSKFENPWTYHSPKTNCG